jgi:NTE family protein
MEGMSVTASPSTRAIVLSGGGARGAYEAGVLHYLVEEMPVRLGHPAQLDLVLGTSVGAIHACYLVATAHQGAERAERLRGAWLGMRLEEFLRLAGGRSVLHPRHLFGWLSREDHGEVAGDRLPGILDVSALERLVQHTIAWEQIAPNLAAGHVQALCVAATELSSGRAVLFAEGREVERLRGMPDPSVGVEPVSLQTVHALASAAIPGLFPAVRVGDGWYVDGGLRLNTPLAPAVHLGADRILVVALRSHAATSPPAAPGWGPGSPLSLYGRVLDTLLLDPLESDLARMRFVNAILRQGEAAFGDRFLDTLNATEGPAQGRRLRIVEDLVIRPSRDPARLAAEAQRRRGRTGGISRVLRAALGVLGRLQGSRESDLLSYLLFDRSYTELLFELGRGDARAREEELCAFFSD